MIIGINTFTVLLPIIHRYVFLFRIVCQKTRQAYCIVTYRPYGILPEIQGEDVAMVVEGIIRKTCRELDIKIIDISVNCDHVHLFIQYPPEYSVSFIASRLKGRSSRILRREFPELKRESGANKASGHQAAIMEVLDMAGLGSC